MRLASIAPRLARARDGLLAEWAAEAAAARKLAREREQTERLLVHRELQLLRAAAYRPAKGKGGKRKRWVKERARKLDQTERRMRELGEG